MSPRIQELARQAVEQVCSKRTLSDGQIERVWHPDQFNQVFAELIVGECIDKIENEAAQYHEPVWAVELVNDIKEHFGIEEETATKLESTTSKEELRTYHPAYYDAEGGSMCNGIGRSYF